jgi:hypothetical protein
MTPPSRAAGANRIHLLPRSYRDLFPIAREYNDADGIARLAEAVARAAR